MNRKTMRLILSVACVALVALSASADTVTMFTNRSAWQATAANLTKVDFEGLTGASQIAEYGTWDGLSVGGLHIVGTVNDQYGFSNYLWIVDPGYAPDYYDFGTGAVLLASGITLGDSFDIYTPVGTYAIGLDLMTFEQDMATFLVVVSTTGWDYRIFEVTANRNTGPSWVGFQANGTEIIDITIFGWSGGAYGDVVFPVADNIEYAMHNAGYDPTHPGQTIPEPGSMVLLGSGLMGIARMIRRKAN